MRAFYGGDSCPPGVVYDLSCSNFCPQALFLSHVEVSRVTGHRAASKSAVRALGSTRFSHKLRVLPASRSIRRDGFLDDVFRSEG